MIISNFWSLILKQRAFAVCFLLIIYFEVSKYFDQKEAVFETELASTLGSGFYLPIPGTNWTMYDLYKGQISENRQLYGVPRILG